MSLINKLKSFVNLKTLSVFTITLFLGLIFNSLFGRHVFRYSIVETFTETEAIAKLNKRIIGNFSGKSEQGTVVSYHREADGTISIEIKWDLPIAGRFDKFSLDKETYQGFVTETGE